jgi:hypothetical protein
VDEPIIRIGNDFFTEKAAENVNVILSQMDKNTARIYKAAIEEVPKKVVDDGTAYNRKTNVIGFDKTEVDNINGDIVIHETTHYMDFNTPMVYEHTSTRRVWARDENDNLLEKDGKPYRIEETKTTKYDCNSVTDWISFAYDSDERVSDWEKAVSIIGVNKENATPFNDWIKPDDLTARREAYRQWVKDKNISQEDLPHISLEKPVTLSGAAIKDFIYHKIQKLLDKEKLTKAEKEQLAYIKKLDIVVNNGILYDLSIDELTAIGYFDENKYVYDEH